MIVSKTVLILLSETNLIKGQVNLNASEWIFGCMSTRILLFFHLLNVPDLLKVIQLETYKKQRRKVIHLQMDMLCFSK